MILDLRSDTVTKPTSEMLEAMFQAEVGDDVFDEDPTVKKLEQKVANLFGHESALFCPSGTMTNQIAIRISTEPQDEIICDHRSHIYRYEGGGVANNSLVSLRFIDGDRGRITADQIEENINPDDIHFPKTALVSLENTVNKGGGCYYKLDQVKEVRKSCDIHHLKLHLDGARLFNALVETQDQPNEWGKQFDTISVCLSKGLGAPIGSLIVSSKENIKKAKRVRKVFGGGMRQVGYLAAAGVYALDYHVYRLKEDHTRAKEIGKILENHPLVKSVMPVDTNIVIFTTIDELDASQMLQKLESVGIKAVPFGKKEVRLVTHLDFTDDMLQLFKESIGKISS
ncbi:MAG: GntG family PLP-dependent aldolase [Bacteroidota bacterium]